METECLNCDGTGTLDEDTDLCPVCDGTGVIESDEEE